MRQRMSCKIAAERLLLRRDHSVQELGLKLKQRKFLTAEIKGVIENLIETRLLCDQRFAENYCRMRAERGYGYYRIREELLNKGISQDIVNITLNNEEIDWHHRAKKVRYKRFGAAIPDDLRLKAKQQHFLQYRGFTFEQIERCFEKDD